MSDWSTWRLGVVRAPPVCACVLGGENGDASRERVGGAWRQDSEKSERPVPRECVSYLRRWKRKRDGRFVKKKKSNHAAEQRSRAERGEAIGYTTNQ